MHKIIKENLKALQKNLKRQILAINNKTSENPADDFFQVRKEFEELLNSGIDRTTKAFSIRLNALARREVRAKRKMKDHAGRDIMALSNEKFELECAYYEINNMLFFAEQNIRTLTKGNNDGKK